MKYTILKKNYISINIILEKTIKNQKSFVKSIQKLDDPDKFSTI